MQLGSEREREKKQSSEYTEKKGAALMMRERERSGDGTKNSTSSTSTPTPTKKNQKKTYLVPTHRTVVPHAGKAPQLAPSAFVAPSASVIGDVTVGEGSSIWYNAVLRGDVNSISIGSDSNIQDAAVVHVAKSNPAGAALPTRIGDRVTVGHGATVHAATLESGCFVGMGAVVLDGAVVKSGAVVAAGAVVAPGAVVPSGEAWGGAPAKKIRAAAPGEAAFVESSARNYAALAAVHALENAKSPATLAADAERRADGRERSADYDSHLGIARDPVTREIVNNPS